MVRTQRLELIINQSPSQEPLILVNGCVCVSVYLSGALPTGTSAEAQHRRRRDSTRFQDQTKEKETEVRHVNAEREDACSANQNPCARFPTRPMATRLPPTEQA